jgi:hypothetical protein
MNIQQRFDFPKINDYNLYMKILFITWLIMSSFIGVFYILDVIIRSLPEGHRLRVWWNRHVVSETDLEDTLPPSDESGS